MKLLATALLFTLVVYAAAASKDNKVSIKSLRDMLDEAPKDTVKNVHDLLDDEDDQPSKMQVINKFDTLYYSTCTVHIYCVGVIL